MMKSRRKYTLAGIIIGWMCTMLSSGSYGQHFSFRSPLPKVDSTGFYRVEISPEIISRTKPVLEDVRILDKGGKETPYIVKTNDATFLEKDFEELPIILRNKGADNQTQFIIENTKKDRINNLLLFVKNAEAQRTVALSGTEDTTTWYVIKENLLLSNYFDNASDSNFLQFIAFPPVNYRYFKLTVLGTNVLPVNIVRSGVYKEKYIGGKYVELPDPQLSVVDSANKKTYIRVHWNEAYQLDKLELNVTGAKYYKRNVLVYAHNNIRRPVSSFILTSNRYASFPVQTRSTDLLLEIDNEDNPPLQVRSVRGLQLNKYLLTYLEKGKSYQLMFGDKDLKAPSYDLAYFSDSIPAALPSIEAKKMEALSQPATPQDGGGKTALLWIVIVAVLGLLVWACYKMLTDVKKNKQAGTSNTGDA